MNIKPMSSIVFLGLLCCCGLVLLPTRHVFAAVEATVISNSTGGDYSGAHMEPNNLADLIMKLRPASFNDSDLMIGSQPFEGKIGATYATSTEAWGEDVSAPKGAPNILVWLLDDCGYSQTSPFGSSIATPTIQRLSDAGLQFTNFHTTALCSPSRASILTGRNHHAVGFGSHMITAMGFPGYAGEVPESAASVGTHLQANGYTTFALGKWDHTPFADISTAGPFHRWPTGQGFDHFYGFMAADSHNFNPVFFDNHRPVDPTEGKKDYHLTTDIADRAIEYITSAKSAKKDRPFFMYWATGAVHAPHHAPQDYLDKYKGRFAQGWDAERERIWKWQLEQGVIPAGTNLTERTTEIPAWDSLSADDQKLFERQMEAFAAQLEHADAQFGRIVDTLERIGELNNTLILVTSDNGASAEGGLAGTHNELRVLNGLQTPLEQNRAFLDRWGTAATYNHYHAGWAFAGNTPFKYFKQTVHRGGQADPLLMHWPQGIKTPGGVVRDYHHITDIAPTLLAAANVTAAAEVKGVTQMDMHGVSMKPHFDFHPGHNDSTHKNATHRTQYYEMFGSMGIYDDGWKAVTLHGHRMPWETNSMTPFNNDTWELYHVDRDFSESVDLAKQYPAKLAALKKLFIEEAWKYNVFPLNDDMIRRFNNAYAHAVGGKRGQREFVYWTPGAVRLPEALTAAQASKGKDHSIVAHVTLPGEGILCAVGGMTSGFAFYVKNDRLHYSYNSFNWNRTTISSNVTLPRGKHRLEFRSHVKHAPFATMRNRDVTRLPTALGSLYLDDTLIGGGPLPPQVLGAYSAEESFDVGADFGTSVDTSQYQTPFKFTPAGNLDKLVVTLL